jgi:hypothetical protein
METLILKFYITYLMWFSFIDSTVHNILRVYRWKKFLIIITQHYGVRKLQFLYKMLYNIYFLLQTMWMAETLFFFLISWGLCHQIYSTMSPKKTCRKKLIIGLW